MTADRSAAPRRFSQTPFVGPPDATELILVRHGASADAVEGEEFEMLEGQGNPPLSDIGRRQAEQVAERLMGEQFEAIYVSSLIRTAQTAAPLAERCGLTPVVEADLREVFMGEWEGGVLRQKVTDMDPMVAKIFDEQRWDVVPGAEPHEKLSARLRGAVERIAAAHRGAKLVVFSHGAAIGDLLAQATKSMPLAFVSVDNASISRLLVTPTRWMIRGYNETTHLHG